MVEYRVLHTKLVWGNLENIYKDISWEKLGSVRGGSAW